MGDKDITPSLRDALTNEDGTIPVDDAAKFVITNDPNDWAKEQGDEKYILNLLLRIINLSLKSVEIIESLPNLNFEE